MLANPDAETCVITSPSGSIAFDGGYFTAAWSDDLQLTINGYNGGEATGSINTTIDTTGPTWVNLAPLGTVDQIEITGFNSSMEWNEHFALDDLKIHTDAVEYTVTPSIGANGGISPDSPQSVNYGDTTSFTVTPDTGYSIDIVEGCGGTLSGNVYTTGAVTADCEVNATFVIKTYAVMPSAGANGSISPGTAHKA
ncbi:MAG: hypothetical protein D3923_09555 [Candidatus Electrothrix sp. AR3]|nr:hypothetical protein [Candidatus Electrothrix sp. AR3]